MLTFADGYGKISQKHFAAMKNKNPLRGFAHTLCSRRTDDLGKPLFERVV